MKQERWYLGKFMASFKEKKIRNIYQERLIEEIYAITDAYENNELEPPVEEGLRKLINLAVTRYINRSDESWHESLRREGWIII